MNIFSKRKTPPSVVKFRLLVCKFMSCTPDKQVQELTNGPAAVKSSSHIQSENFPLRTCCRRGSASDIQSARRATAVHSHNLWAAQDHTPFSLYCQEKPCLSACRDRTAAPLKTRQQNNVRKLAGSWNNLPELQVSPQRVDGQSADFSSLFVRTEGSFVLLQILSAPGASFCCLPVIVTYLQ